jgi:hypothetical protein
MICAAIRTVRRPIDVRICRIAGVDCADTYTSIGILIHGAVGSTYLSGIPARRCYGFLDDPGPAEYALRGAGSVRVAAISASSNYRLPRDRRQRARRERICQHHRGPQTPMLMNVRAWQMRNMMLIAMIRDASERSCASSYCSRVRRPAASGKRECQQSLINFRFGAPAPRSGLDQLSARAYKGVVPPGGAGRICGPVTT